MHNLRCPFIVPFIASEKGFMHAYIVVIIGKTIYDAEQRLTQIFTYGTITTVHAVENKCRKMPRGSTQP